MINIFTPWQFFTLALADGLSEWQQVYSILQESSQYSGRSQPCCSLDCLHSSCVFFKSSSPSTNPLVTVPRASITIGIIVTFMFHSFFNSLTRSRYLSFFSLSFNFTLWSAEIPMSTIRQVLFLVDYYKIWSSSRDLVICFYVKIREDFCATHSPGHSLGCADTICSYVQI